MRPAAGETTTKRHSVILTKVIVDVREFGLRYNFWASKSLTEDTGQTDVEIVAIFPYGGQSVFSTSLVLRQEATAEMNFLRNNQ